MDMSQSGDAVARSESNSGRTSAGQESVEELDGKFDDVPDGSVFVGDLCKEVLESDLANTFSAFGDVIDVVIKRSRTTSQLLGYGFVTMRTLGQAQLCLEKADDVVLKGRKIRIAKAQRNTKLIVSNLSAGISAMHLNSAFAPYGKVVEEETSVTTCANGAIIGNITFVHRADAEQAKTSLQGRSLLGYPLRIDWKRSNSSLPPPPPSTVSSSKGYVDGSGHVHGHSHGAGGGGGGGRRTNGRYSSHNGGNGSNKYQHQQQINGGGGSLASLVVSVHVKFHCPSTAVVDESVLYVLYQQFGHVTAVSIKASQYHSEYDELRGYAFVHYEISQWGRQAAFNAVNAMSDVVCNGVRYMTQLSRNFMRMEERAVVAAAYASVASSPMMYTATGAVGVGNGPYGNYSQLMYANGVPSSHGYAQFLQPSGSSSGYTAFSDMMPIMQPPQQQSYYHQNSSGSNGLYNSFNHSQQGGDTTLTYGPYGASNVGMDTGTYAPLMPSARTSNGHSPSPTASLGLTCGGATYYSFPVVPTLSPSSSDVTAVANGTSSTATTDMDEQRRGTEAIRLDSSCVNLHPDRTNDMVAEFVAVGPSGVLNKCGESTEGSLSIGKASTMMPKDHVVTPVDGGPAGSENVAEDGKDTAKTVDPN